MEKVKTITLVKITSWEANGYDDSDWDTIYYNTQDGSIMHDFGTTRGYTTSNIPNGAVIVSLSDAINQNLVDEKSVRDAFSKDTFKTGKVSISINRLYKNVKNLNWPVNYVLRTNGKSYSGILLNVEYKTSFDWFGREIESTFGIIYNPDLNKIIRTRLYNVTPTEEVKNKISENFINNASINIISSYVSAINSCSRFSLDWVADIIIDFSKDLFEAPNIYTASNETLKVRKPRKNSYENAKQKVEEKTIQYRNWVNTLDKSEEEKEEIFNKTMNKYLSKEIEIIKRYEEN